MHTNQLIIENSVHLRLTTAKRLTGKCIIKTWISPAGLPPVLHVLVLDHLRHYFTELVLLASLGPLDYMQKFCVVADRADLLCDSSSCLLWPHPGEQTKHSWH
jgi:hypothetical protein